MLNTKIECAGFIEESCDDGPGFRSVLFLQGCGKNCPKCHNAGIKEHGAGTLIELSKLVEYIDEKCCNKKITISGGEPLEQKDSLFLLIRLLKERDYNVCVYTGWEYERIPEELWNLADYIKTGGFESELRNENIQYVGSSNQRMYKIVRGVIEEMDLLAV